MDELHELFVSVPQLFDDGSAHQEQKCLRAAILVELKGSLVSPARATVAQDLEDFIVDKDLKAQGADGVVDWGNAQDEATAAPRLLQAPCGCVLLYDVGRSKVDVGTFGVQNFVVTSAAIMEVELAGCVFVLAKLLFARSSWRGDGYLPVGL